MRKIVMGGLQTTTAVSKGVCENKRGDGLHVGVTHSTYGRKATHYSRSPVLLSR